MAEPDSSPAPRSETPPRYCPSCGDDLSEYPYYQRVSSPFQQTIYWLAKGSILEMAILVVLVFSNRHLFPLLSLASGWAILALIFLPAALLYAFAEVFPKMYRVVCLRCSWYHDYRSVEQLPRAAEGPAPSPR